MPATSADTSRQLKAWISCRLHRDRGEAVALVRRESLVEPAGGEAALDGALAHLKRIGALVPNRETGEITRQKRLAGTKKKLRFVFFRASWLAEAAK
jgi:hypothetical protein